MNFLVKQLTFCLIAIGFSCYVNGATLNLTNERSEAIRQSQNQLLTQPFEQFKQKVKPAGTIELQRTEKTTAKKAIDELEFEIYAIEVVGNTALDPEILKAQFDPYIGIKTSLFDLNQGIEELNEKYRKLGYFLTKAVIPSQKITNGTLKIQIIEGYVQQIVVDGGNAEIQNQVLEVLNPIVNIKPLDLGTVERKILILNSFPGITINSTLRQGAELGSSEMVVNINQIADSYSISTNNNASYQTGPWFTSVNATLNRVLNRNNQLTLSGTIAGDLQKYKVLSMKYSEPMGTSGLTGSLSYTKSASNPQGSLETLHIESSSDIFSTKMSYPIMKSRYNSITIDGGLNFTRSLTTIEGALYSFDKEMNYESNLTFINTNFLNGFSLMNLGFIKGISGGNSIDTEYTSPSISGFDPNYSKVTFLFLRNQVISQDWSASFGFNGQFTKDTLLAGNLIAFGGATVGRGYDNSIISGDKGVGGFFELRKDIIYQNPALTKPIQVFGFIDSGTISNNDNAVSGVVNSSASILSGGFGIRTTLYNKIFLELQFARAKSYYSFTDQRPNPRILFNGIISF